MLAILTPKDSRQFLELLNALLYDFYIKGILVRTKGRPIEPGISHLIQAFSNNSICMRSYINVHRNTTLAHSHHERLNINFSTSMVYL